jgi:hypothetical protein
MALDGPYDDGTSDARPERHLRSCASDGGSAEARAESAEPRSRTEYYEALRAIDKQAAQVDGSGQVARTERSGWDAIDVEDRPPPDSIQVSPERASHILDGDRWGGGHRHGTGRPEKTEFPADWDDERIIDRITDVARSPDVQPVLQPNQRWRARGERDGVAITVIVRPDGMIWSAWPEEGSPGVIRNPRKGES